MSLHSSIAIKIYKDRTLTGAQVHILLVLHMLCGKGDSISTSQSYLAEYTQYDKSTVSRALDSLSKREYIVMDKRCIRVKESVYPSPVTDDFENNESISDTLKEEYRKYKKESYIAFNNVFFNKVLGSNKLKYSSVGLRLALALYYWLSSEYNAKKKNHVFYKNSYTNSYKIVNNLSIVIGCDRKQIQRMIKSLLRLKVIDYRKKDKTRFISANIIDLKRIGEAGLKRSVYLVKELVGNGFSKSVLEKTAKLFIQYPDNEYTVMRSIKGYYREKKTLNPAAINTVIQSRLNKVTIIAN